MRNDSALLGKAFDVFRFFCEVTQWNKQWEVSIAMTSGAKHRVELMLHVFPNPVTPRANDHATAHVRRLGQFGRADDLLIPFRKIFLTPRGNCRFCGSRI